MGWLRDRRVLAALGAAYVVGLAVLVVGPWGWTLNRMTVALYVRFRYDWPIAPRPMGPSGALRAAAQRRALRAAGRTPGWLLHRAGLWWVTAVAALGSAVMKGSPQWAWLAREGGWPDVVANTLGALIGAARSVFSHDADRDGRRSGSSTSSVTSASVAPDIAAAAAMSCSIVPPSARASHTTHPDPSSRMGGPPGTRVR